MRRAFRMILCIACAAILLGGCGIFGCAAAGGGGSYAAGCNAGVRF